MPCVNYEYVYILTQNTSRNMNMLISWTQNTCTNVNMSIVNTKHLYSVKMTIFNTKDLYKSEYDYL